MDMNEFLETIGLLASVAGASGDENLRRLGAALYTMKGAVLAGGPFLESYLDQQQALNMNMKAAAIAAIQKG